MNTLNLLELYYNAEAFKSVAFIVGVIVAVIVVLILIALSLRFYYVAKVIAILISLAVPVLFCCLKYNVIPLDGLIDPNYEGELLPEDMVELTRMVQMLLLIAGTGLWVIYSFLAGAIEEDRISANNILVLLGIERPTTKASTVIAIGVVGGLFGGFGLWALTMYVWEGFVYVFGAVEILLNVILVIVNARSY